MDNCTLKLTTPYMHGSAVMRLQEFGDLLGVDHGENDGIFGPATFRVVNDLQVELGLKVDGVCGPETWSAILAKIDEEPMAFVEGIYDRRGMHKPPKLYARTREWESIAGVTLHQTGCRMPIAPKGWDRLNAHIGITRDGKVIIANDPCDMIWHAQGLSKHTIGIEIAGNYAGIDGNPNTVWKGGGVPNRLNREMMRALDRAFQWICDQFEENGRKLTGVFAHRQSAPSRIADPGSEIWQKVAMPWMDKVGIVGESRASVRDFAYKNGRPIPREWDGDSNHNYY